MSRKALLLVDVQYDFSPPNGSLAVPDGNLILVHIYDLLDHAAENYEVIAASMDCECNKLALLTEVGVEIKSMTSGHPVGHISFASTHSREPFTEMRETPGSMIEQGVQARLNALDPQKVHYIRKGKNRDTDAYSAFADSAYTIFSPLAKILHKHDIHEVDIAGLALDFCVKYTAVDSRKFGIETRLLKEATRATDASGEEAEQVLQESGVHIVK